MSDSTKLSNDAKRKKNTTSNKQQGSGIGNSHSIYAIKTKPSRTRERYTRWIQERRTECKVVNNHVKQNEKYKYDITCLEWLNLRQQLKRTQTAMRGMRVCVQPKTNKQLSLCLLFANIELVLHIAQWIPIFARPFANALHILLFRIGFYCFHACFLLAKKWEKHITRRAFDSSSAKYFICFHRWCDRFTTNQSKIVISNARIEWKKMLMATDLIKVTENDARPVAKCPVACFAMPKNYSPNIFCTLFFVLIFFYYILHQRNWINSENKVQQWH